MAAPPVRVPVLADPVPRGAERVLARFGLIGSAPPVFAPCARAPLAGLLLAVPALAATGLLETAHTVYGALPNGFYSLDTMLCEGVFRALLGEARAEGAVRVDPVALGRVLGLDRAPEVKTIRRKIGLLAEAGQAGDWIAAMARRHVEARPEQAAVCYVDGHVRAYQGTRRIAKTHVPRLKFPAPATVETWVSDAAGDPLLVVMAQPGASLAGELRRLIPELRAMVGDDRRVLVGFDRGGWSATLFADLDAAGFDTLTWRKGTTADIDEHHFATHSHTDEHGRTHTWRLADTEVALDIAEGPRAGEVFAMRQISLFDAAGTRQMHILTTRRDLPAAEIRYRMGSRWRQENHYRYARIHFDLDSHDTYRAGDDDPDRMVPNPAKKPAYQQVEKARRALHAAETTRDRELLAASTPPPGATTVLTNQMIDTINTAVHAAEAALDAALAAHQALPARLPLAEVHPGQQVLDTETKLIHHAIRIAAYNTTRSLARAIVTATGYTRADDEAHTLIRTALTGSGDIIPDRDTLHLRLDPLPAPRHTAAIDELCHALNDTHTVGQRRRNRHRDDHSRLRGPGVHVVDGEAEVSVHQPRCRARGGVVVSAAAVDRPPERGVAADVLGVDQRRGGAADGTGVEGLRAGRPAARRPSARRNPCLPADFEPDGGQADDRRTDPRGDQGRNRQGERPLRRTDGRRGERRGARGIRRQAEHRLVGAC